jgi:hypothetical protein
MIDRSVKMERINLYLAEYVEEPLTFVRGETRYALLGINLATGEAYIEEGEGIGTLPLLDAEIETLYWEILRRQHTHLGHST